MAAACQIYYMSSNINTNAFCNYTNGVAGVNPSVITIYNAFTSSSPDYWATDLSITANKQITLFINTIINPGSTK